MNQRLLRKWTDRDGTVWTDDGNGDITDGWAVDEFSVIERKWGPLTPVHVSWWERLTATWQVRLALALLLFATIIGIIAGTATAMTGYGFFPAFLFPFGFVLVIAIIVVAINSLFAWVFPQMKK